MAIRTHIYPNLIQAAGASPIPVWDIRARYEVLVNRPRQLSQITSCAIHHDGVLFAPGDRDYNGTTDDEDLDRLDAIYRQAMSQSWGRFPYHMVVSPNRKLYWTLDSKIIGANVKDFNTGAYGLAVMGEYTNAAPSAVAAWTTGAGVGCCYRGLMRKVPVKGHREYLSTTCPGNRWADWKWIVQNVANASAGF